MYRNAKVELESLDPTCRLEVNNLYASDSIEEQASKIFEATKNDIFMMRLKQMVWNEMCASSNYKVISKHTMRTKIQSIIEESGAKELLMDVALKVFERAQALHMRTHLLHPMNSSSSSSAAGAAGSIVARTSEAEQIDSIRLARIAWEDGINEELLAIASEAQRPFTIVRAAREGNPLLETEAGQRMPADSVKFLFDSEDLLETGVAITNYNLSHSILSDDDSYLGLVKLHLDVPDLDELTQRFAELSCAHSQLGADDGNAAPNANRLIYSRHEEGEQLLLPPPPGPTTTTVLQQQQQQQQQQQRFSAVGKGAMPPRATGAANAAATGTSTTTSTSSAAAAGVGGGFDITGGNSTIVGARKYLRRGSPPSLRAALWRKALGLSAYPLATEDQTFRQLRLEVDRLDLLTDELFLHDIESVVDDPRFFVFEEELKEVVFSFSRDEWVRYNCYYQLHKPLLLESSTEIPTSSSSAAVNGNTTASAAAAAAAVGLHSTAAPPSTVQPFLGFATYFAPFCYVYRNRASLYTVCRQSFASLWCKLNVLTSDRETLLAVCKTFECLLMQVDPRLFIHLVRVGVQPLKIVFPWIQLAFVGVLEVDQILHLWDRVFGYMDPTIFAVAAVSMIVYRAESLFRCTSEETVQAVLGEFTRVKIIPLIQMLLFNEPYP